MCASLPSRTFRVGVVVRSKAGRGGGAPAEDLTRHHLKSLCRALGDQLETTVRGRMAPNYTSLVGAIHDHDVDLAWLPPVVALRAAAAGSALPIAMPVRDGAATFHTALFAQANSPWHCPADLHGVRAAWVDRQSASGYLVIRGALRAQGVHLEKAFCEEHVVGSHDAVVEAVRTGRVDVGATFVREAPDGRWIGSWGDMTAQVIARVGPVPNDVIAAGTHLHPELTSTLRDALLAEGPPQDAATALVDADYLVHADATHLDALTQLLCYLDAPLPTTRRSSTTLKRVR